VTTLDIEDTARLIMDARADKRPIRALTDTAAITMEQAYEVQAEVTRRRIALGQRVVGWKLGYTSQAMREQMGIGEMNFGPLTDAMTLPNHALVPESAVQPLVEPEAAFILAKPLRPPCGIDDVLDATAGVRACLEVVDPIWTDRRFLIQDNTADGSSAAFYVLGDHVSPHDLPDIKVALRHDGVQVAIATAAAAGGHPAAGVAWLAAQLGQRGLSLNAGDVVLTGGLTKAIPLEPGHSVSAEFTDRSTTTNVSVSR
jgi:2-keto-4-pentenoate hydratase